MVPTLWTTPNILIAMASFSSSSSSKPSQKRRTITYMLRQYEAGKNPNKTVTLLKAVQWTRSSWEQGVTPSSIQKCFWKPTIIKKLEQEVIQENQQADRDALQAQITGLPGIEDPLSLNEFIEPADEVIDDEDGDIFASVVDRYRTEKEGTVEEPDEDDIEIDLVPTTEALKAIEIVKLWEIQQENREQSTLSALDRIERRMVQARYENRKQTMITSFFKPRD